MAAILIGLVLAIVSSYLVLQPLLRVASGRELDEPAPLFADSDDEDDPILARRDRALAALKEIDFDRATGKLSDADYESLKAEFTQQALDAITAADAAATPHPAPSPQDPVEALISASRAGPAAAGRFCLECGTPIGGSLKFCQECGTPVAALKT